MTATTMNRTLRGRRVRIAAGAAVAALALAGCAGGGDASSSSADRAVTAPRADKGSAEDTSAGEQGGGSGEAQNREGSSAGHQVTSARVLPGDRDIVYRGSITVRVKDVARAAARAEDLALQSDGVVFSQETIRDPRPGAGRGGGQAQLTLRVPPTAFAATLDALGGLGRELTRSRSAQDVTTEMADTDSRVRSQQRSVERVRALLAQADTIGEVVQIESELARREADLESLQAQLARLKDVTDLATIEVSLVARGETVAPPAEDDGLGFLTGLRNGWDAFVAVALVALTAVGAVLPFALLVLLVGAPAYVVLRSRRRAPTTPPTAPTEA